MKKIWLIVGLSSLALAGCGGGDNGDQSAAATPTAAASPGGTLNGSISKGPVNGATVCAYRIDNSVTSRRGAQVIATGGTGTTIAAGCAVTAADGAYSLILPSGTTGDLMIETSGGTWCSNEAQYDKASLACLGTGGVAVALGSNALRALVTAPASGVVASTALTPFSTAALNNAITAGSVSFANYQTAFNALITSLGLPSTITVGTLANSSELQSALAAVARVFGTLPSNYTQTIADLALARYRYSGGSFTLAPVASTGEIPTFDTSKCPVVINAGTTSVGAVKNYSSCAATAVADFSKTLVLSVNNTRCNLTIASGVFTLTNGTQTAVAAWNGEAGGDDITTVNDRPSSLEATSTAANGDIVSVYINFGTSKIDSAGANILPRSGTNSTISCLNI